MGPLTSSHIPTAGDALLVVDMQNDFMPGGSLAVHDGHTVIPAINRCISLFSKKNLPIYVSRNWQPTVLFSRKAALGCHTALQAAMVPILPSN